MKEWVQRRKKKISHEAKVNIAATSITLCVVGGIVGGVASSIVYDKEREKNRYFKYDVNESGEYVVDGIMKFEELKKCYFVEIKNSTWDSKEFYICRKEVYNGRYTTEITYFNLLNNEQIFYKSTSDKSETESNGRNIVNETLLEDYLYTLDEVKAEYTPDDVKNILEQMKEASLEKENKVLVKSTFNKYFTKV